MNMTNTGIEIANIKDYETTVGNIVRDILQSAFEVKELKPFLDRIVKMGAKALDARSCAIFLLEEDGKTLKVYAASGKVGDILKSKQATYYVPDRDPFTEKGEGKKKIEKFLQKKEYNEEKLRRENKSLMDVIKESEDDLIKWIEDGELPTGITAGLSRQESLCGTTTEKM